MEEGQNFISQKSITVDDLTVTYRNGHTALRSASFSIPEGSITGLVGVNGSGKSTLFKALMGFIPIARLSYYPTSKFLYAEVLMYLLK